MQLVQTNDFETVKNIYIDVIENTPQIEQHAQWVYGNHPTDELLKAYIDRDEMYILTDGHDVAGVAALSMSQGKDYESVKWQEDLRNDEAAALHLLAVRPAYRGRSVGSRILEEAEKIAAGNGKKALRLDTLTSNFPAQHLYEKYGFVRRGGQRLYIEGVGVLDFIYYEKILG